MALVNGCLFGPYTPNLLGLTRVLGAARPTTDCWHTEYGVRIYHACSFGCLVINGRCSSEAVKLGEEYVKGNDYMYLSFARGQHTRSLVSNLSRFRDADHGSRRRPAPAARSLSVSSRWLMCCHFTFGVNRRLDELDETGRQGHVTTLLNPPR